MLFTFSSPESSDSSFHIFRQYYLALFKTFLNLDDTLVVASSETKLKILSGFDKFAVHKDICHFQHWKSIGRMASLVVRIEELFKFISGIGPDGLARAFFPDTLDKWSQYLLIYHFPRFAAQYSKALDIITL